MSELIPYDEMRRLCGLPDIKLLRAMDWARKQSGLPYVSFRDGPLIESTKKESCRRGEMAGGFVGGRQPESLGHLENGMEVFTDPAVSPGAMWVVAAPPKPKPPKSKHVPPMWANNPTKQRRTK